ncbi:WAS/WASL-interacting protein family member 1-like [Capricornis sumatraensis]|uniref:WAS/WASL-interacting protein family member 1-like n=1 Tax=Capricornis sumatraensis TaxID=34865 RepID=UPI003604BE92
MGQRLPLHKSTSLRLAAAGKEVEGVEPVQQENTLNNRRENRPGSRQQQKKSRKKPGEGGCYRFPAATARAPGYCPGPGGASPRAPPQLQGSPEPRPSRRRAAAPLPSPRPAPPRPREAPPQLHRPERAPRRSCTGRTPPNPQLRRPGPAPGPCCGGPRARRGRRVGAGGRRRDSHGAALSHRVPAAAVSSASRPPLPPLPDLVGFLLRGPPLPPSRPPRPPIPAPSPAPPAPSLPPAHPLWQSEERGGAKRPHSQRLPMAAAQRRPQPARHSEGASERGASAEPGPGGGRGGGQGGGAGDAPRTHAAAPARCSPPPPARLPPSRRWAAAIDRKRPDRVPRPPPARSLLQ